MLLISVVEDIGHDEMDVVVQQAAVRMARRKMAKMERSRVMVELQLMEKRVNHVNVDLDLVASLVVDMVVEVGMEADSDVVNQNVTVIQRMMEQLANPKAREQAMAIREIVHHVVEVSVVSEVVIVADVQAVHQEEIEVLVLLVEIEHHVVIIPIMILKHFWN